MDGGDGEMDGCRLDPLCGTYQKPLSQLLEPESAGLLVLHGHFLIPLFEQSLQRIEGKQLTAPVRNSQEVLAMGLFGERRGAREGNGTGQGWGRNQTPHPYTSLLTQNGHRRGGVAKPIPTYLFLIVIFIIINLNL